MPSTCLAFPRPKEELCGAQKLLSSSEVGPLKDITSPILSLEALYMTFLKIVEGNDLCLVNSYHFIKPEVYSSDFLKIYTVLRSLL